MNAIDPSTWATTYPNCGGSSQSPIDIVTNDAVDKGFNFFGFSRYAFPQKWGMTNNGHTSKYSIGVVLQMIDQII